MRSARRLARTVAVGVVLPVHDEELLLPSALVSLRKAFVELATWDLTTHVVVVLDSCSDRSADVLRSWTRGLRRRRNALRVTVISCDARNVGHARALGFEALVAKWSDMDMSRVWFATSDADSQVPRDWLKVQVLRHEEGVDLWAGRVSVADWAPYGPQTALTWQRTYDVESNPVHGANLGFNAQAYRSVGGFTELRSGEDRALCSALVARGIQSHYDSSIRVVTSSRRDARAPMGFAHALSLIEASCATI